MYKPGEWLTNLGNPSADKTVSGLVLVADTNFSDLCPEQVVVLEKAKEYGAYAVFFEGARGERAPQAQAFIFTRDNLPSPKDFGDLHKRLWSWGGVPLLYLKTPGLIQLFRCAHKPDFVASNGDITFNPKETFAIASDIASDPWWSADQLYTGALWDDPNVCDRFLSSKSAHKSLIDGVKDLKDALSEKKIINNHLQRKLLVLSILIAYLEERGAFEEGYFAQFVPTADHFPKVLENGNALIKLLSDLEDRFNGHVFVLEESERRVLKNNHELSKYADFIHAKKEKNGQLTLWQLYSFKDLPVELISHIYQLFVKNSRSSVYTPPFLVRLMLDEILTPERIRRLHTQDEIILDPSCGSGIFLVEAYKRLILHWRNENNWDTPSEAILKKLIHKIHGIDIEKGAVELASFSLCLALCDALKPDELRTSKKLFPPLMGKTLHESCFFKATNVNLLKERVGVIVGNPPFESKLSTPDAQRSYKDYQLSNGQLPDKQIGYLFLHEAMRMLVDDGILCMLQQYNFLYNLKSKDFRTTFIRQWDVRELLDFVSIRGMFSTADTKVVAVVALASKPREDQKILHATFRRTGRVKAAQGFDIDYYDLHWIQRHTALKNQNIWRANLFGGGRVLPFIARLKRFPTLEDYAKNSNWNCGAGFTVGSIPCKKSISHIINQPLLPADGIAVDGIHKEKITKVTAKNIERPRTESLFTPPMLLVGKQMDIPHGVWDQDYMTYTNAVVGFSSQPEEKEHLVRINAWLTKESNTLRAYVACISQSLFTPKATAISQSDIFALPYPPNGTLDLSLNEQVLVKDIVDYYRDFIRLGENSRVMKDDASAALSKFNSTFTKQINNVYTQKQLKALEPQCWSGIICQPYVFGDGKIDWDGADSLRGKLNKLLYEQQNPSLRITRIARIYDDRFIFLLKPDRLRYWLRSIALRDADETLSDMRSQGF